MKKLDNNGRQFEGCLLCRQAEGGSQAPDPDVDFICSNCIQRMLGIPHPVIIDQYEQAWQQGHTRTIYALASFVPAKIRQKIQAGIAYVVTASQNSKMLVKV